MERGDTYNQFGYFTNNLGCIEQDSAPGQILSHLYGK